MKFRVLKTEITISYLIICTASICIIAGIFDSFLYCLFAIIIHETGHIILMCIFGYAPEKIKISLFEISISDRKRQERSFILNFLIIFFGPFANFICFILFYLLYLIGNDYFLYFAAANFSVGLFNILPVMSLDGGQLLYLILSRFFSDTVSQRIVNVITFIIIFPLATFGFILLFNSKYNFSLLIVCIYLVFSLICRNNKYF
ncbi:site-2 protease family protein [Ruminococcus sp.]|uniref:site-2 protease family protein n=1 Tax=Ruminococcus sp. TaxID=41978 RepID=UPI002A90F7A4|nr:site-2 protease family protein [Ruminococcus sp.]MDY6201893.1 site-2 protease family protein [Ruminococcus sp.]